MPVLVPPVGTVYVERAADGPGPCTDEPGAGDAVAPVDGAPGVAEPVAPPEVGFVDALDGAEYPPCSVTTAPPGEKVTVLVHSPAGAALVAVAVMASDWPPASVPELWLSVIHESCVTACQAIGVLPELRSTIATLFGSAAR